MKYFNVDFNKQDSNGYTPLHRAASKNDSEIVLKYSVSSNHIKIIGMIYSYKFKVCYEIKQTKMTLITLLLILIKLII